MMTGYELIDFFNFIYNLGWLVFLIYKHYGKVTTTAGHIFELNVMLNVTISNFLLILIVDLEVLPSGILSEILDTTNIYSFLTAMTGSQIETVVFLKTLNVNTMMTNTAGKIILAMNMLSYVLAIINTLALPSMTLRQSDILFCDYLTPMDFFRMTLPGTVVLVMVLSVMGFAVFRGFQFRRKDNEENPVNLGLELEDLGQGHEIGVRGGDTPSEGRLFTIQSMISELNQVTPREIVEEDLVIQDIELANTMTSSSIDHAMIHEMGCVPMPLPGIIVIMNTIQKYMKNTMISLLILTCLLPWYLTGLYGFITNSGCEDPKVKFMADVSEYGWIMLNIFLPLLIKLKLDRLSE